jgi:hypothetical protein
MAEINLGPFALSVSPLLILISVIIGFIVASIVAKKNKTYTAAGGSSVGAAGILSALL